ncbi:LOW QUALITY PROTEIN: dynein heavy chain domain-containing protein 1 [Tenrec ecaudatus]|uniref:LOW QUALITY PROTEIN: dynein heavy chain domain-containing protein 1 n=1 Tax=Tenrec ecaudatus TaxID=94439 RepID=UPI003F59A199
MVPCLFPLPPTDRVVRSVGIPMIPHQQLWLSGALPPVPVRLGEAQQPTTWNWQSNPEHWASSIRQQLNAQLLLVPHEEKSRSSPDEASSDGLESWKSVLLPEEEELPWTSERKQKLFLKAVTKGQHPAALKLLLDELQSLLAAVLQDCSPAAWHYLHTVLGLLPPYRSLLCNHLDLLPFLEQLYRWAPWVQSQLHLDILDAIDQAFPPDNSLLAVVSHIGCHSQMQNVQHGPPYHTCPFVQARCNGQQVEEELATWLRPLTLPELQNSVGIVGAEVALEETPWLDGLNLLPLALATDIPVQYESTSAEEAEEKPIDSKRRPPADQGVPGEKTSQKRDADFLPETSLLRSHVMNILQMEKYLKTSHFLYLNVAPSRHFRPYNLVVVPPNKVNPEHYIFSPFGILHMHPVEGSDTMTLGTWHRHSVLWQKLQFIPFFKNYLVRKALTRWKKTVKFQVMRQCQLFLRNHLLSAVPHFGAGLLHVSRLLQELHCVPWLPQEPDQNYELLELQKALTKANHKALRLLCRCLYLCTAILKLIHEDTYQMQQGLQERVLICKKTRKNQGSIFLQRVQRQELEQRLKQAEAWLLHLGQLARLVDYMTCQSLVTIMEKEITSFVANNLQNPRQKPFLKAQLVFDSCGQLSHVPSIEKMMQILSEGLQNVKTSVLQVMQSSHLQSSWDSLYPQEYEEDDSNMAFLMSKSQDQRNYAARIFCGPDIGLVWPWKSRTNTGSLQVRGYHLRGQFLPFNYKQLQEDLDSNPQIQQAMTIQQALMEGVLCEVQEFCGNYQWLAGIYEFLQTWGPQKLEAMRGCPIQNYRTLVSRLNTWQARVSTMPIELITKGRLLLLSCREMQAEMDSKLDKIRNDILAQLQDECQSRTQQLIAELTDFMKIFQTINSDIHAIARCSQKLNEANEKNTELEDRVEYTRLLHEVIRNQFNLFSAENEALDVSVRGQFRESPIAPAPSTSSPSPERHPPDCPLLALKLLDTWEAFQFEKSQAAEFLLSKQHAIVPKLQQLMAAALVELEVLLEKAVSSPFMDPTQEQRSIECQLISLERQFQSTVNHLDELHHAYATFTGDETPVALPACGTRPIVQQQRIWHLYRIISEHISEWKCMAFIKFNFAMAMEKTDAWLTEVIQMITSWELQNPVLHCCQRMLEEFRSYLPLLIKLSSLQLQHPPVQSLLRALGLGSFINLDLLTLGQLINCPLLEFSDRINQMWQCENDRIHAQDSLRSLQRSWEGRQLRLLNFILRVPYEPPAAERSKRQALRGPQWDIVCQDSGTFILSDCSSLLDSIQETLRMLFKILATQKSGDLHKTALEWMTLMHSLGALLEVWGTFQQKWIFLNKVLHEMKIQFPTSEMNARFKVVDDQYRTLMKTSVEDPLVLSLIVPSAKRSPHLQGQQLQQVLHAGSVELEGIIVTLEGVLYRVRARFPRFFFLSDSELVALLAAPLETCEAQKWAHRCFPHVLAVRFQANSMDEKESKDALEEPSASMPAAPVETTAVLGAGGEVVKLQGTLPLHPDLPKWLASLETSLRTVLVSMLQGCVATHLTQGPPPEFFQQLPPQNQPALYQHILHWLALAQTFPWQCVLVAEQVVWRAEMEEALLEGNALAMVPMQMHKLEVLVHFLRAQRVRLGGQPLPSVHQASLLSALLVLTVRHRDIAQLLRQHDVSDLRDFHWARQLKYHLGSSHMTRSPLQRLRTISKSAGPSQPPAPCWIEVLGHSFQYNYEYLGPRLKLLPTLLHERPALVLLLALDEVACGTLLGPDGVGKTTVVTNLARALGRHLVILPCLSRIEVPSLSNYLNGALQAGAWLMLKAAEHLPPGLLSALGQRLAALRLLYAPLYQEASQNTSTIDPTQPLQLGTGFFENHHVNIRLGYGCLLTLRALSPTVPANLRLLLRPVALTLPDLYHLAEMTLQSAGIRDPSRMATRLTKFFSLERELVPGPLPCRLPLLKQVLEDTIQRLNATLEAPKQARVTSMEEASLLQALLHSQLFSSPNEAHLHKLRQLLCGLFPGASQVLAEPATLRLTKPLMTEALQQAGLHPSPDILGSVEQLSQALNVTSGILLLGPAGSGKTTCWHSLFKIQNQLASQENVCTQGCQPVEITSLYPSVLSPQEFLGWLEGPCWHHGVFPRLLRVGTQCKYTGSRKLGLEPGGTQHWVVCDGTPSAAWLDPITYLLSDPPKLSLPNGQEILRPPDTFFLMEVADVTDMSPTVVGRCALVWCGGEHTWQSMLSVLMKALPQEYRLQRQSVTQLNHLAEVLVPATLQFLVHRGAGSVLQVHGQQAVCPGVAEVTSLARIFRALLDPYLRLEEKEKTRGSGEPSSSEPMSGSFRYSKHSSLGSWIQVDGKDVWNKQREHLLAVNSFLYALIWGFGALLPSRFWPLFDTFLRDTINSIPNYPEPPQVASLFDLYVCPEDGTLVPFNGQSLNSCIKGAPTTFSLSPQMEQLLYAVDLLLSRGQPVLLAGEAASGKSAFVEVLVEPNHPYTCIPINPMFTSTHLRLLLSRGTQGQAQTCAWTGHFQDPKGSLLFLLEDLHLAASDPEKSCQPVLEVLRQALHGTVYAHRTLELQTVQPTVNFFATATVAGYCERPLCPRLFRLFTVLALSNMTRTTLLSRHAPSIQAWLERFPSVDLEGLLAGVLIQISMDAWEAVCRCFMPSPLHPHYRFSLHLVDHLLSSLQLLPTRLGSRGFLDCHNHQARLHRVSGFRGTRLTTMMATRNLMRFWLHEAQRTFCDRLDGPKERSRCAKILLEVAQTAFCLRAEDQKPVKGCMEEKEEEKVPEVESDGELAQWGDSSNSGSESEEEGDHYALHVPTGSHCSSPSLTPSRTLPNDDRLESRSQRASKEEIPVLSSLKLPTKRSRSLWQKITRMDMVTPLLLPVLLLHPQEKPSDLIFSQELILGSTLENPNLYLERQWASLEKQLAASAAQLKLKLQLAVCRSMTQHVARLVRVLARPRQHGMLLSRAPSTGRHTAITLAANICQAHLFHLPTGSEEAILQCLRDASWHAGVLNQQVVLLVPEGVDVTTFHRLLALATSGSFPDQHTEADLDALQEQFLQENLGVKQNIKKEMVLQRFYQQVCSQLHLFFLIRVDQAHNQLPPALFLRLLQLAVASIDHYEPWEQADLVSVAQHRLEGVRSVPLGDGSSNCPDLQASVTNVSQVMALIHLSAASYLEHLCPALSLATPKTYLDFLNTFLQLQHKMALQMRNEVQRIQTAVEKLTLLMDQHSARSNLAFHLEQQLKTSRKSIDSLQGRIEQDRVLYRQQLAECQQQEKLIENLTKQRDALQAQQEVFLEQMGKAFLGPLSQLQVTDFEELRSYRAPPEAVVQVTDALCDLFHREPGWASAKQLLCTEDFYQELMFFPKEMMTDTELMKLSIALQAPSMSDAALRAVSVPAARLTVWLWAVLRYGWAQRRGMPTGLLLRQVEATLAREQTRLGQQQFEAHETLKRSLDMSKKMAEAQIAHNQVLESLIQAQYGKYYKWPIKTTLLTPMAAWTTQQKKLIGRCKTVFGDALMCAAAFIYLGPFPPARRQELLHKWLALCSGFQESLGPDDVAQALKSKQKSVTTPITPLLPTHSPFSLLSLLSSDSEQHQWDRKQKPQAKSARLAGLLLRSLTLYHSSCWPLLLDPNNQALIWLDPPPLGGMTSLISDLSKDRGKHRGRTQDDDSENTEDKDQAEEQEAKAHEDKEDGKEDKREGKEQKEDAEQDENENEETELKRSKSSTETQSPPLHPLQVLSGADPELGLQLQEAAANGMPILLTKMEFGLRCPELQWLLQREQLSPPQVQPGFSLYLSTTLPLRALGKVLSGDLLKGLSVLDLSQDVDLLEETMLYEIVCLESPELETHWQELKISFLDTCKAVEVAEEKLLVMLLGQNTQILRPDKFLRNMVRTQAELCHLHAKKEELEELRMQEMVLWAPYRHVVHHGMALVQALRPLQNLMPLSHLNPDCFMATTTQILSNIKKCEAQPGEDMASHLLQMRIQMIRQMLGSTVAVLGVTCVPLVGAVGALALLQAATKTPELERLALWPGLATSPSTGHSHYLPGVARPAWLGLKAWHECGMLEMLAPFAGLRVSLVGQSETWQAYLSLSSTVLGPAPGPGPDPLSLLQKLILWRVLRPDCLAGALADFTTSVLGRPLDETLGAPTMPLEASRATQPMLVLLPPPGHPTATLHPLTVIQKLAADKQGHKHLQVIALGCEAWDPVPFVVNSLRQAMHKGYWLVLDNCHLMSHWPQELLQPLLDLSDAVQVVSDLGLELVESTNVPIVHREFRLWLILPAEAIASLPVVLTQHSLPVFWDQSLELGCVLADSIELAEQGACMPPLTQALPLFFLHGLLLHRQLYGLRLQAHRGHWSQDTLTHVLQTQGQLWASLSNPRVAMQELAVSVFYGGPVGDIKDRETLISLTGACLSSISGNWTYPQTPQHLLATLTPSPELGEQDAIIECKAQMRFLPTPPEPRSCGLSAGPQAWLMRRRSRALLSELQRSSQTWVPGVPEVAQRAERRLRHRLVQVLRRLEVLRDLLSEGARQNKLGAQRSALGPTAQGPLEGFLESEALELQELVSTLQCDLACQLEQLKGAPPCASRRCAAVAQALWAGRLPPPWRRHAPAGPQPPWHWLRQLSRRGHLLTRYLSGSAGAEEPERTFHLSAFGHPRRLLLALRREAALDQYPPGSPGPASRGSSSTHCVQKRQELTSTPLHFRVRASPFRPRWTPHTVHDFPYSFPVTPLPDLDTPPPRGRGRGPRGSPPLPGPTSLCRSQVENGPNPTVPEAGLLLTGLQVLNAEWDPLAGALQDSSSSQPSPLPPVSVSTQAQGASHLPAPGRLAVYSCPVYMEGPLGTTRLHSRNILIHLPLPTKLSLDTCTHRRVYVCSPPLP